MEDLKEQISDFRQTTPKHVQWLLLVAALIVVLILLTLMFTGRKKSPVVVIGDDSVETSVTFKPASINWARVTVGDEKSENVQIYATTNIKVSAIELAAGLDGLTVSAGTCKTQEIVGPQQPCQFTVKYKPKAAQEATELYVHITYIPSESLSDKMKLEYDYKINLGAIVDETKKAEQSAVTAEPKPVPAPAPIKEPEETKAPKEVVVVPLPIITDPADEDDADTEEAEDKNPFLAPPKDGGIKDSIGILAPADPFKSDEPLASNTPTPAEACSEFALPGYNSAGRQIGWIKPEHGAYYFHPFSDKTCDNPTGIYNPENGIITDIKVNGKRIGTDAERIGYGIITNGTMPKLSNPAVKNHSNLDDSDYPVDETKTAGVHLNEAPIEPSKFAGSGRKDAVYSSQPYDRRFVLRQYKPIPATIVSDVRADPSMYNGTDGNIQLPVRATVDRNVYADNGRTIIIPTGTLMLGYVTGKLPGPYTAIGRMQIKWYQFVLPNGVEFNFNSGHDPFSADSQGRAGVPGRGSTDYIEQFVMPMITAIVPAAVNMIAPIADRFVNQIDLDNNTVVQSGTMRSSELAKNEIITAWNQVAQKLMVDMMDNTTPPFSIAAGTRITVYSPEDLIVSCGEEGSGKECALTPKDNDLYSKRRNYNDVFEKDAKVGLAETGWVGQVREFKMKGNWCVCENSGACHADQSKVQDMMAQGYSFSTVEFYCQTQSYKAINNAKQETLYQNQQSKENKNSITSMGGFGSQTYNEQVLGLKYDEDTGAIKNPFAKEPKPQEEPAAPSIGCLDGTTPDANGCCTGETYTDMGEEGWNCCPADGGDCFPPIL